MEEEEEVNEGNKAGEAEDSMEETLDLEALLAEADDEEKGEAKKII